MLSFDQVTCARGGQLLFADLSFALQAGGAVLVTGPNGAGKSSLIRLAAGLLPPAAGTVTGQADRALLTEHHALDEDLPLAGALDFWAKLDGRAEAVAAALDAMALVDLAPVPVRLLSTGQRRRAAIARVIASGAPVWLLDEPANGLDAAAVTLLESAIAKHRASGGAVLVASHTPIALPDSIAIQLPHPGEGSSGRIVSQTILERVGHVQPDDGPASAASQQWDVTSTSSQLGPGLRRGGAD